MKTIINNENKKIQVTEKLFSYLKEQLFEDVWMVMIKVNNQPHMIPTNQFA